jgi:ketosteroid isomerase-like protein
MKAALRPSARPEVVRMGRSMNVLALGHKGMSTVHVVLDKVSVRETIEDYLNFLDAKDWDGIARCFSNDAQSLYNFEPDVLQGRRGVADWLRMRVGKYGATDHALSNLHIVVNGDLATCYSRLTASLLSEEGAERRISVRAIWYRDKLRREGDRWLIYERVHEPQWQYDVPARAG